ncbi:MAG: DUF4403 family protein, partial [Gemmatimonadota bacterium]
MDVRRRFRARVFCAVGAWLCLLAGCDRHPEIDAPPPDTLGELSEEVLEIPPSIVQSEIRYDLAPALAALEKAVPRTFGDIEQRLDVPSNGRMHVAFSATRSPFTISVDSQRVTVSGVIEFEGRGWYKPVLGPEISAACGTGEGVERPRARVRLETALRLTDSWALDAKTRVTHVAPYSSEARDKCTVTIFHIDVTDRVMRATREKLQQQVRTLDRALAQVQTRERFERWWRDISRPIRLTDSIYLTINPHKVQLGGVTIDSGEAVAHVRLEATPRIVSGSRPNDFELFTPLPPLQHGALSGQGMRVSIQGEFGYDIATGLLRKTLIGRSLQWQKRVITIRDVTVAGIGGGKVSLGLRFGGAARGLIYLTGTPSYDNGDDQIVIPDLDYDLQTSSMLVKGLAYLGDEQIRDALREYARFPITGHLDRLRTLAVRGMNRELTKGVELVASLEPVEHVTVHATRAALILDASARGDLRLDIDRAVKVKKGALA